MSFVLNVTKENLCQMIQPDTTHTYIVAGDKQFKASTEAINVEHYYACLNSSSILQCKSSLFHEEREEVNLKKILKFGME